MVNLLRVSVLGTLYYRPSCQIPIPIPIPIQILALISDVNAIAQLTLKLLAAISFQDVILLFKRPIARLSSG